MTENNVNKQTGEIVLREQVVQENDKYLVTQLPDGTFRKQMKYEKYFTHIPQTQEDQILLYKVFNSSSENNDLVIPFGNMVGQVIGIDEFYQNPYESFDEKTGVTTPGVTTTIKDGESFYSTSSKSVYHTLRNLCDAFGYPNTADYKKIYVTVTGTKRNNGVQIDLALSHIGDK